MTETETERAARIAALRAMVREHAAEHEAWIARVKAEGGCPRCSDKFGGKIRKHRLACPKNK